MTTQRQPELTPGLAFPVNAAANQTRLQSPPFSSFRPATLTRAALCLSVLVRALVLSLSLSIYLSSRRPFFLSSSAYHPFPFFFVFPRSALFRSARARPFPLSSRLSNVLSHLARCSSTSLSPPVLSVVFPLLEALSHMEGSKNSTRRRFSRTRHLHARNL